MKNNQATVKSQDLEETAIRVHEFSREQWANLPSDQKLAYTREIKRILRIYEGVRNTLAPEEDQTNG